MSNSHQTSVVIVYHSGYGHTEALAKSVAKGAQAVEGTTITLIKADDENKDWDVLAKADAIVFGSPTYMGSVSAPFKGFMDESSKVWFTQGWKDKIAAGFTVSASQSGDKLNTLIQMAVFAGQHGMNWVSTGMAPGNNTSEGSVEDINRLGSYIGLMAQANGDQSPDVAPPATDHRTAEAFGSRIAQSTRRWASAA
ncbi:flavodoxin family protein [Cohaesibacter celericrescens]|uniref:NADPH-dependent FMN reductase n=2 Tax=Cohaesibacter celericrescens TaxID=2067669 RepID=A0A2N5XVC0_9HYPH|nr:flavodoxin family protein [Cohaesibacter celericrescens]PLW78385.1 NADPH-dependent FMN reductase [Cohaesibacter celericrescens]